jgi:hypothetical protein
MNPEHAFLGVVLDDRAHRLRPLFVDGNAQAFGKGTRDAVRSSNCPLGDRFRTGTFATLELGAPPWSRRSAFGGFPLARSSATRRLVGVEVKCGRFAGSMTSSLFCFLISNELQWAHLVSQRVAAIAEPRTTASFVRLKLVDDQVLFWSPPLASKVHWDRTSNA